MSLTETMKYMHEQSEEHVEEWQPGQHNSARARERKSKANSEHSGTRAQDR